MRSGQCYPLHLGSIPVHLKRPNPVLSQLRWRKSDGVSVKRRYNDAAVARLRSQRGREEEEAGGGDLR